MEAIAHRVVICDSRPEPDAVEDSTLDLSLFYLPTWREGFSASRQAFYEELIGSVKQADRLGWSRVMTTEHHFHYYGGAVPNPAVMMAAWARETERIRLAAAVSLVPLRHPLQVAEDYALVDQLSNGRFDMGVSRGFVPHEFEAFHVPQAESIERVYEGLEIIEKFWAGEPFAHRGKHWSFDTVEPWPVPVQARIPVWVAASNARESFEAAGRAGYHLMMNQYPMSFDSLVEKFGWYKDAWIAAGHDPAGIKALVAFMTYLADTEEAAIARAKGPLQEHAGAFGKLVQHDQWNRDYAADEAVLMRMSDTGELNDVFRRRTLICSPGQATERIAKYVELGFTEIAIIPRFADLSATEERETIERVTEEVMPALGFAPAAAAE